MEPATIDRVQRMIDDEAAQRFPADAAPRLVLLRYGDHPVIEPGELYLRVVLGGLAEDAWMREHGERLWDFLEQRLPEVKGVVVGATSVMFLDGNSLLDQEQDELARGFAPVMAHLGPVDLATLDALITAGIAASRTEGTRWALARVREQPAYAELSERAPQARPGMARAERDRRQSRLGEQVRERFPDGVQRVALLRHGDDPWVEPGDLLVRVYMEEGEEPLGRDWEQDHLAVLLDLHRELAETLPGARYLEFWFGENHHHALTRQLLGCPPDDPARQGPAPVGVRLGPADLAMLDTLITAGAAARRGEAIGWVLARIRERPAYARLGERARELDELKARF